jgi:hypothetical protein
MNFNFMTLALITGAMISTAGQSFAAPDADTISMNSAGVETPNEAPPSLAPDSEIESTSVVLENGRYHTLARFCDYLVIFTQEKIYLEPADRGGEECSDTDIFVLARQPDGTYSNETNGDRIELLNDRSFLDISKNVIFRKISDR